MNTKELQIKALDKARKKMLNKGLKIGINYKFKRKHGDKSCVKVLDYNDKEVQIRDNQGMKHWIPLSKFTSDNFER